jgi:hypothetical protein
MFTIGNGYEASAKKHHIDATYEYNPIRNRNANFSPGARTNLCLPIAEVDRALR